MRRKVLSPDVRLIDIFIKNIGVELENEDLFQAGWDSPVVTKNSLICAIHRIRKNTNLDIITVKKRYELIGYICMSANKVR